MARWFASGRVIDAILVFMAFEAVLLIITRKLRGADTIAALAPGACLLLALRAALRHEDWTTIAALLLVALFAHLSDLRRRWTKTAAARENAAAIRGDR
ncbi:MAG: hypothetical protein KGL34_11290 [Gammaproteobacteria bacterium]|nr:hypothetical protein [Gammaproteobacteria bacterium]